MEIFKNINGQCFATMKLFSDSLDQCLKKAEENKNQNKKLD